MRVITSLNTRTAKKLRAAATAEKRSVSSFVALLIEREVESQEADDLIGREAKAAAKLAGHDAVFAALKDAKGGKYKTAA